MRVLTEEEASAAEYEVEVKNPATLFAGLEKIDYIKCDIEGYEVPVIPAMRPLIEKHRPILQIETGGENKRIIMALLQELGYKTYFAGKDKLMDYKDSAQDLPGDLIGIPKEKNV
jgi:hypothetical protein